MTKELKFVKPYYMMEPGDTMVLSNDGKSYVSTYSDEYHADSDDDNVWSTYSSTFTVSTYQAEILLKNGIVEEVNEVKNQDSKFINVFDEIDSLIALYTKQLTNLDEDYKDQPLCLKNEKLTVLDNLIKLLNYLKQLKK